MYWKSEVILKLWHSCKTPASELNPFSVSPHQRGQADLRSVCLSWCPTPSECCHYCHWPIDGCLPTTPPGTPAPHDHEVRSGTWKNNKKASFKNTFTNSEKTYWCYISRNSGLLPCADKQNMPALVWFECPLVYLAGSTLWVCVTMNPFNTKC